MAIFNVPRQFAPSRLISILISLLCLAAPAMAQDFEGKNIVSLEIRYRGAETIDKKVLLNQISSKPGTVFRAENTDNDITALYESGFVDDAMFLAEAVGENGVKLICEVTTRPMRDAIGFVGNTVFKEDELAKATKLGPSGVMSDAAILEARRNLEKYYRDSGYPDVMVDTRVQPTERAGHANLIFLIDEGLKFAIRKIRFEGNRAYGYRDLIKVMELKRKNMFSWLTKHGRFEPDQLDEDLNRILDFYRENGYLRVSSPGFRREPVADGKIDLVLEINEGEKYTVDSVGFGQMSVYKSEELYPSLSLTAGDVYSGKKVRDDITMIRKYYGFKGYADAAVQADVEDSGPNRVKVIYRITEGQKYKVGRVNIAGNTLTKDKVIRRELPLQPGDLFNTVELETAKSRLKNLRYFSRVEVDGIPATGGYRDIDVLVEETKTGNIGFGVFFSSTDSIGVQTFVEESNFDLFNPGNPLKGGFKGGGQRMATSLRVGTRRSEASISLTEPWFLDQKLALGTELFYRESSSYLSTFYEQSELGVAVSLSKPLSERSYIRGRLALESIEVDSEITAASFGGLGNNSLLSQSAIGGDFTRISLGVNYVYDSRDSVILPRTGQKVDIGLTYSGLGGDVDTVSFSARGASYWNLKYDAIFSLNGEMAFVDGSDIPIFERMFLGGPATLRGFDFRDVGPRDTGYTNDVYGGASLGFLSAELSVPVVDSIWAAVFADAGFVNADKWDPAPDDIYSNVGVGLRLILPISPVPLALDYAIPTSSPDKAADQGNTFNFSLQTQF